MDSRAQERGDWPRWIDPETILKLDSLELRARIVVDGFLSGLHRSPYHGFSAEFSEYRAYVPGDDLRYLDWKLYARSDRQYIKRFEDETNVRCQLLVDLSRSMGFGHERSPKSEYAITLAATLARFLSKQRDAVGLLTFDEEVTEFLPARHRPGHLQRLLVALERSTAGTSTGLVASLQKASLLLRKRGVVVLISDLLSPLEGLDAAFGQLAARGHEVLCLRVLDPAEVTFPFEKASRFEDLESGESVYVDPKQGAEGYRERFDEHRRGIEQLCHTHGIDLVEWTTDRALSDVLHEYLQARVRRGVRTQRRGNIVGGGARR